MIFALAILTSCGVSQNSVKKTVAIEKNCPKEKIEILEKTKVGLTRKTFKVSACGETYIYKAVGRTITEKGDNINW